MNDIIKTKSIGNGIADIEQDFELSKTPMSRLILRAQICHKGIRGKLIRQRRLNPNDEWIHGRNIDIRDLDKDTAIALDINSASMEEFYKAIHKLARILEEKGIEYGTNEYAVVGPEALVITDQNKAVLIKKLINSGYNREIWDTLADSDPNLISNLSHARVLAERKAVIKEFRQSMAEDKDERYWQNFFELNTWIFGFGLRYQFLHKTTEQPIYRGANYRGTGAQKGDFMMNTAAEVKFTVLVEIKKPQTEIVLDKQYRNSAWRLGEELLWAVSQLQINCNSWDKEGSKTEDTRDQLESENIFTIQPKGILVIGNTNQLTCRAKKNTFEIYRRELRNPEIITFDELYERARFLAFSNVIDNDDQSINKLSGGVL